MRLRVKQWGQIWHNTEAPLQVDALEALIQKGQEFAKEMQPLTQPLMEQYIWKTIKQLSLKAPGLDGVGFDFLKALPFAAMKDIKEVYHHIEATGKIPAQWST